MKTRIAQRFADLAGRREKGFVAYLCAGDPSLGATVELVLRLEDAGADIIELGIPFSDPLADGKVNQQAAGRALEAGTTVRGVLDCTAEIRGRSQVPIIFFTYLNPLCAYGIEAIAGDAVEAGVDGMLVLDLPVEEGADIRDILAGHSLDRICLIAPTSTDERVRKTVGAGSGFIYCVSRAGVTGMQAETDASAELIGRARAHTQLPIALGFGVSTPEQARHAVSHADAVVVGSAIVQRYHESRDTAGGLAEADQWVKTLVQAVKER